MHKQYSNRNEVSTMNQNDSKDPRELEQERLKFELEKTKLELERLKLEHEKPKLKPEEIEANSNRQSSKPNYIPENLTTIAYSLAFLPPIGIILVWIDPKMHIILKLFSTCFGLLSLVVLIVSFRFLIYPLFS